MANKSEVMFTKFLDICNCLKLSINTHVNQLLYLYFLPAYMKVVILLRSNGGAHFDSIAAIEGNVTACTYRACKTAV